MKVLLSLIATLGALLSAPAFACSCAKVPRTTEEHVEQSDLVILGRATGVHRVVIWDEGFEIYHSTKFLVLEALKGIGGDAADDAPQFVYVRHPGGDPAACGVTFDKGVAYRVFANRHNGKYYTNLCGFSVKAADPNNMPWEDYRRAAGKADAPVKERP